MAGRTVAESDYAAGQSTRGGCGYNIAFSSEANRTGSGVYSFSSLSNPFKRCVPCATDRVFNDAGRVFSFVFVWKRRGLAMGPAPKDVGIMTIQILIIGLLAFIALGLSTIADTPNEDSE